MSDGEDKPLLRRECDKCALRVEVEGMGKLIEGFDGWMNKVESKVDKWDGRMWAIGSGIFVAIAINVILHLTSRPSEAAIAAAVIKAFSKQVAP